MRRTSHSLPGPHPRPTKAGFAQLCPQGPCERDRGRDQAAYAPLVGNACQLVVQQVERLQRRAVHEWFEAARQEIVRQVERLQRRGVLQWLEAARQLVVVNVLQTSKEGGNLSEFFRLVSCYCRINRLHLTTEHVSLPWLVAYGPRAAHHAAATAPQLSNRRSTLMPPCGRNRLCTGDPTKRGGQFQLLRYPCNTGEGRT